MIGEVTLLVPDYGEAIAWFTGVLGFELVEDNDLGEGKRWVRVRPPASRGTCLLLARAATPEQRARIGDQAGGRVALFLYTDDFSRDHRRFQANGVTFLEEPRHEPYGTVAVFQDPWGNRWDLLQPAAGWSPGAQEAESPGEGEAAPRSGADERHLRIEEQRLALDRSFARKWLPTLVTLTVGAVAAIFGFVEHQGSIEETKRAAFEARVKDEHEWGAQVVQMYFQNRELFDLAKNPETAVLNLRVLATVAPTAVRGVLDAERSRIPPPSGGDDTTRLDSLAAVAGVQEALAAASPESAPSGPALRPADFTVYLQYAAGDEAVASKTRDLLLGWGYRVPGREQVDEAKLPPSLQVRYYLPEQKAAAGELAAKLGEDLGLAAGPGDVVRVRSAKQLPGGILEVWLPPQASQPRPGSTPP